jgi:cholinesterase
MLGNCENEAGYYKIAAYGRGVVLPDSAWAAFNDQDFTCATSLSASFRRAANIPTWRYRYFGDWDNLRLYPTSGAYHGSDLEMVFAASPDVSGLPDSADENAMQAIMQNAWAAFASDPNAGLRKQVGWPVYDGNANTLIALAQNNSPSAVFVDPKQYEGACGQYLAGYQAT